MITRTDADADADPDDGRDETLTERLDRNWLEILQELRVVQTGTQILTGFLLAVAFQPRFGSLDPFQRTVYLLLVTTAALTTAAALAPVILHRALFRRHARAVLVRMANLIVIMVMGGVGLLLTGVMLLIFDVTVGRTAGLLAAAGMVVVLSGVAILPLLVRRRFPPPARNP